MARSKNACIIPPDEVNAIGGTWFDDGACGYNKVQRAMLELINQLDGFDPRGNLRCSWRLTSGILLTLHCCVLAVSTIVSSSHYPTSRAARIFNPIHARSMSTERNIRFDLIARLCTNITGAEPRLVATETGMYAIRARRKVATERDFPDAVEKVVHHGTKFSRTPLYQAYN